jgi:membrane protease YdiL (CAAX protease family)
MTEASHTPNANNPLAARNKRSDLIQLAFSYGLIVIVCWTPRPWQRLLWWIAASSIVLFTCISFDGLKAMGLGRANFLRSLWIVAAAFAVSALAVIAAIRMGTLHLPDGPILFLETYWAYALWAAVQQFLLQIFFLSRLRRLLPNARFAAIAAAVIFSLAHLPSPILVPVTLLWGLAACLLFLRYRNLYPLAMAHAILGITIAITIPGPVDHNMRVGLGYLKYRPHVHQFARPSPLPLPQPK